MNRPIYIILMITAFLTGSTGLQAMPPHPDLIEKWRAEGTLEKNVVKSQSAVLTKGMAETKASGIGVGTIKIPVIPVRYNDTSASFTTYGKDFFSTLLNTGSGPNYFSVQKYYNDMSNGTLIIQFDVFDPVTVSQSRSYYGADGSTGDVHPGQLVYEAVNALIAANGAIDFSDYDNDGNGFVDAVVVIHAGAGQEISSDTDDIHSHQWDLYSANYYGDGGGMVTTDGVKFNVYTMQPEYVSSAGDSTIGVFCHELGHVFGLPDSYDTTYDTNGVGDWSLMSSGSWGSDGKGTNPAPLLAWERYRIGGSSWVHLTEIIPDVYFKHKDRGLPGFFIPVVLFLLSAFPFVIWKTALLRSAAVPVTGIILSLALSCNVEEAVTVISGSVNDMESGHKAYRIPLPGQQYLILEGKTAAGSSGWYVPGTGVLVTHIHDGIISKYISANEVNAGDSRVHGINIVEAKTASEPGRLWTVGSYNGSADDLFCSENKSSLTADTTPGTEYYTSESVNSKTGNSGVSITAFSSKAAWPITFHAEY